MKKLFGFLLLLLSLMSNAQSERDQKLNIRTGTTSATGSGLSRTSSSELFQKQQIVNDSKKPSLPPIYNSNPGMIGWNRWNRWGAPYSFLGYDEFWMWDRWGYRYPVRVYQTNDGRRDTVSSKKTKTRLGLSLSTDNEIGAWITIGRAIYFKGQFHSLISSDKSEFYNVPEVNFYNATVGWDDQRLDDIVKGWSVYLGVGREFKHFGLNLSLGIGQDRNNFQFFDEYYVLSGNGKYSFKNFVDDYVSLSVGLNHDYEFLSVSADFDPIRKNFWLGVGFNF